MQVINRTITQSVTLTEDLELWGTVIGDVVVTTPHKMEVKGTVQGSVTIEKGATVYVDGSVIGDVKNAGRIEVYGILKGQIIDDGGEVYIDERAMVL